MYSKSLNLLLAFFIFTTFTSLPAIANEESTKTLDSKKTYKVTVTATRVEEKTEDVASSVKVVTKEEIEQKKARTVLEVLQTIPSVQVIQSGGPGQVASVFLRGAKSEHTLIMIDGVELNDPIAPGRSFNFANLGTDNIERIEIITGPQSTLYGSDAMGGVINIITTRGKGDATGFASFEGGSFNTFRGRAALSGKEDMFSYSFAASRTESDGFSAADENLDGNSEGDGYENTSASMNISVTPNVNTEISFMLHYSDSEYDIDNAGGAFGDDPNFVSTYENIAMRGQASLNMLDGMWKAVAGFNYSDTERTAVNEVDPVNQLTSSDELYNGDIIRFDIQNNLFISENNTLILGAETEEETGSSTYTSVSMWGPYTSVFEEQSITNNAIYAQDTIRLEEGLTFTAGLRYDDHEIFGDETTYRFAGAWKLNTTKLHASYGTGFKAPSLYQLYSSYGSVDLQPETSTGFDAGISHYCPKLDITLSATYFFNEFENLIDYNSATFKYSNISEAETRGVELSASGYLTAALSFNLYYTYTDSEDKETEMALIRRAEHTGGFDFNLAFSDNGNAHLTVIYVGERDDLDFSTWPSSRVTLDSYFLVNLAASMAIVENLEIFARVNNLFDEEYYQVLGYGTAGISGFIGTKYNF